MLQDKEFKDLVALLTMSNIFLLCLLILCHSKALMDITRTLTAFLSKQKSFVCFLKQHSAFSTSHHPNSAQLCSPFNLFYTTAFKCATFIITLKKIRFVLCLSNKKFAFRKKIRSSEKDIKTSFCNKTVLKDEHC